MNAARETENDICNVDISKIKEPSDPPELSLTTRNGARLNSTVSS